MIEGHPDYDDHERVCFLSARVIGAPAIIAIHRSVGGVAGGGVRFFPYSNSSGMFADALKLSRAMSFKNALADIPIGGGKSVVCGDPNALKTRHLLLAFGRHLESLSGAYIAGPDLGTNSADMAVIAQATSRVIGVPGRGGDTSAPTAVGVLHGIRATALELLGTSSLEGVSVAVQGAGGVGSRLCALLVAEGARTMVADSDPARAASVTAATDAQSVAADEILSASVDILVPSALGGILNSRSIPRLRARAICGPANNQLERTQDALLLRQQGVLYAPDYVVNSGGAISAAFELGIIDQAGFDRRLRGIGETLSEVFRVARTTNITSTEAARRLALGKLGETDDKAGGFPLSRGRKS